MNKILEDDFYFIILSVICALSALSLIIIKVKNWLTAKNIKVLNQKIKPFEIKIDKNAEKLKPAEMLEEGDVLTRDIKDKNNFPLYSSGMVVTEEVKKNIIYNNIGFIWVKIHKFKGFE
ncbi:MAG TPA: hypothetical protein PKY81_13195 [bacterium]|nr:hypothetical protein [bacterium]HPN31903.1 hypothetical protein [bacterium]